jgi:hypothetical protein
MADRLFYAEAGMPHNPLATEGKQLREYAEIKKEFP